MKLLIFTSLCACLISSCQKQKLVDGHPLLGKWKAVQYTVEDKCMGSSLHPSFDPGKPLKKVEIEILKSGEIVAAFEGKKETLRIREIKESVSSAKFYMIMSSIKEYTCKVKNKKGQTFNFHFYFDNSTSLMVGTYWTPYHPYYTVNIPNSAEVGCKSGIMPPTEGYMAEFFVKYQKL